MRRPFYTFFLLLAAAPIAAQQPYSLDRVTAADYARAEQFLSANAAPLVHGAGVRPVWLPDGRAWAGPRRSRSR